MRYRRLGKTGFEVSEVGFGGWSIGGKDYGPTYDRESVASIHRALELGVTFFDTADMYGDGRSERLFGETLAGLGGRVVIATKGGYDVARGLVKDFSRAHLESAVQASLKRLKVDIIDLYQLHNPVIELLRQGDVFEIVEDFQRRGLIRHYGISVGDAESARLVMARGTAATLQLVHNLLRPQTLQAIAPEVERAEIGIIVRTPIEYGILSGKYQVGAHFHATDHRATRWTPEAFAALLRRVESFRFVVRGPVRTLAEAAVRYVLASPVVSTVIPGIKNPAQIEEFARASDPPYLPDEDLRRIADFQSDLG
ncbi:MAG: aldo/keto reductase [Nitrospirae bacterium]|nr:aldo/keto reductase [Nitrospirota bacterium]